MEKIVHSSDIPMPLRSLLERWLLLWLCLLSLLAFQWPAFAPGSLDPFTASQGALPFLIAGIMFAVGCLLPPDEVRQIGRNWPVVLAGTVVQYTTMPLLAFLFATMLVTDPDTYVGVILVGCVPGAMASNVLTLSARGNVSYSVCLTTLATMLSPLVVPIALYLTLGKHTQLNPVEVFLMLLLTVAGPVFLGYSSCRMWPWFAQQMKRWGPILANLAILWVIAVVVALNRDRMSRATVDIVLILLLINLLGYLAGYLAGFGLRLDEPMRRALTIEIGMQNAGLGATLALSLFPGHEAAAIPPAFYTFGCMLTGTMLALFWSFRHCRPNSPVQKDFKL